MENLKKNSVLVPLIFETYWPQFNKESTADIREISSKLPGCYATNNSTICFVDHNGEVFATPFTREAINTLKEAGFTMGYFYVPMSNGDLPKDPGLKAKWETLRIQARKAYERYYEEDCAEWCDAHNIGRLSEETMKRCFRIPANGIQIEHPRFKTTYYPICNETNIDCTVIDKLGCYSANNGKVVFVYRDGHTYIAKGYGIFAELIESGYQESNLFVPMSNGETIINRTLAAKWENLPKK